MLYSGMPEMHLMFLLEMRFVFGGILCDRLDVFIHVCIWNFCFEKSFLGNNGWSVICIKVKVQSWSLHSGKSVLTIVHITPGQQPFSLHTVLFCCLVGACNLTFRHDLSLPSLVLPFYIYGSTQWTRQCVWSACGQGECPYVELHTLTSQTRESNPRPSGQHCTESFSLTVRS